MELRKYLFSYRYEGAEYSFEIPAYSVEEAKGRAKAIGMNRYDGELVATIPAYPGGGIIARMIVAVRNYFAR